MGKLNNQKPTQGKPSNEIVTPYGGLNPGPAVHKIDAPPGDGLEFHSVLPAGVRIPSVSFAAPQVANTNQQPEKELMFESGTKHMV